MKPNERLIGEYGRKLGKELLDLVAHCFREEEHHDIWVTFTEVCQKELLQYETERERMLERLYGPGSN